MSLIRTTKIFPAKSPNPKHAFLLCGFGGSIWQLRRLVAVLNRDGYTVTAMDFPQMVLSTGDPELLPRLISEVVRVTEARAEELKQPILLVGVSLGALISLNILRRSAHYHKAVLITGGDIVKVAQRLYGSQVWPQSYQALAAQWKDINMYSNLSSLKGKQAIMILPVRDKLIDPDDVRQEIAIQQAAGNDLQLIERRTFGHVGTIIEEAILLPHRTRRYIADLDKKVRPQSP